MEDERQQKAEKRKCIIMLYHEVIDDANNDNLVSGDDDVVRRIECLLRPNPNDPTGNLALQNLFNTLYSSTSIFRVYIQKVTLIFQLRVRYRVVNESIMKRTSG